MVAGRRGDRGGSMSNHLILAEKPAIVERLAIVDGLTRSGKKLSCRILSMLEGVDFAQYHSIIEKIVWCTAEGLMPTGVAVPLLQTVTDEHIYNRAIGRNINNRPSDETCIYKSFEINEYLRRMAAPDGKIAMDAFIASNRVQLYYTHFTLSGCSILFDSFPYLKMIHIRRNPIDLAEDWLRRGWGERYGTDPLAFALLAQVGSDTVPWFAAEWGQTYLEMTPAERCIESILHRQQADEAGYSALKVEAQSQILRIPFEWMVTETTACVDKFSTFLNATPHKGMASLLLAENCPRVLDPAVRQKNLATLAVDARPEIIERLQGASEAYDQALACR